MPNEGNSAVREKMKKTSLLLFTMLLLASCTQIEKQSARELDGLRGPVNKVFTISYDAIDKFGEGEIVTGKPRSYGSDIVIYDSLGNVIRRNHLHLKSKLSAEMSFDKNGRLTRWINYDDYERISYNYSYEYNEYGDQVKEIDLKDNEEEYTKIIYNEQKQKIYSKDDFRTITYKYEGKNLVEKTTKWSFSTDVTKYVYDDNNNLIEEVEYDDGILDEVNKYEYDANGNKIKSVKIDDKGQKKCVFYKYDSFDRAIDIITTTDENFANGNIVERVKRYYANDSTAVIPYHIQKWNDKGEMISDSYNVYFKISGDTVAEVSFSTKDGVKSLVRKEKKSENEHNVYYKIESSSATTTYNYVDGKLVYEYDSEGRSSTYEYDKEELIKSTEKWDGGKAEILYKNGRVSNRTYFDDDNNISSTTTFTYEGDAENGTETSVYCSEQDNYTSKTTFVNGRRTQVINTSNGITVTKNFIYNEFGDIVLIESTDGSNSKFIYEYDSYGN